jgi:hypothetical protein
VIQPGDEIEIKTATEEWLPAVAESAEVRHDKWSCYAVRITCGGWDDVNWPLDHVRRREVRQ